MYGGRHGCRLCLRGSGTGRSSGLHLCVRSGQTWTHEGGKFQSSAAATLKFDIEKIDLDKQSAKLVLEAKQTGELRIVRALNANSFLEVAQEGFLNLTTVYDKDPASGIYPAVHSRHLGLLGQPIFAQYPGTCTAR